MMTYIIQLMRIVGQTIANAGTNNASSDTKKDLDGDKPHRQWLEVTRHLRQIMGRFGNSNHLIN